VTTARCLLLVFRDDADRDQEVANIAARSGLREQSSIGWITALGSDPCGLHSVPAGVLVGTVFPRHGPPRAVGSDDERLSADVLRDGEAALLAGYWGSYILALQGPEHVYVQPDPTGTMPCYVIDAGRYVVFSTDTALLQDAGLLDVVVEFEALAKYLYFADLPIQQTALLGVSRILGGSAAIVGPDSIQIEQRWTPWDFVDPGIPREPETYAERLRRTVSTCVSALGAQYNTPLLAVSGGLDSSIIAAALDRGNRMGCVTVATEDLTGDERIYARALCEWLETELHEEFYSIDDIDLSRSCVSHKPYPCGRTQSLAYNAAIRRSVRALGSDVVLTGNGGDNVFFHSQSARPITDRLRAEGFGFGVLRTLRDVCALTGCSAVAALKQAIAVGLSRTAAYQWRFDPRFLMDGVVAELSKEAPFHPWLDAPSGALRGKAAHVAMILRSQNHLEMLDRSEGLAVLNPLLSQPIVELCLEIPIWFSCAGGRDRSIARSAFADRLPSTIVNRRTKGGPDGFASRILRQYRSEIRERLMDGNLATSNIIDRSKIELATRPDIGDHGESYVPLLHLVDTEAWIDHWRNRRPLSHADQGTITQKLSGQSSPRSSSLPTA
jgi:asparagine synthase (glutamine-hydrolysing)